MTFGVIECEEARVEKCGDLAHGFRFLCAGRGVLARRMWTLPSCDIGLGGLGETQRCEEQK